MTGPAPDSAPRVALVTYSTRPRGGVVHTLHLAESLHALGYPVHVFALGDPAAGFFRPVAAPTTIVPAPAVPDGSLEERVFASVDALSTGLLRAVPACFEIVHAQDCIASRAATALRGRESGPALVRTVHHIDDFTTPALIDCQDRSVIEADHVLVVSQHWRQVLADSYGIEATVVTNGVEVGRFARNGPASSGRRARRAAVGAGERFVFLTVGGIEPRKGSLELMEAMGALQGELDPPPMLVVVGGHSFQDHRPYREAALARAAAVGLKEGRDLVILGTVPDAELPGWYHAADAFAFPSAKEGFGLAILEAMAAGLPVVASDIPVFREFLGDGSALLTRAGDAADLARGMHRIVADPAERSRLAGAGPGVARRFSWETTARQHLELYRRIGRDALGASAPWSVPHDPALAAPYPMP